MCFSGTDPPSSPFAQGNVHESKQGESFFASPISAKSRDRCRPGHYVLRSGVCPVEDVASCIHIPTFRELINQTVCHAQMVSQMIHTTLCIPMPSSREFSVTRCDGSSEGVSWVELLLSHSMEESQRLSLACSMESPRASGVSERVFFKK